MATNKNITMKQFNGVDYDILYPKTIASQIDDVYSKNETSNLFLPKAGGSMGGILDMNGNKITNLPTPTSNSEPATKGYVDGNYTFTKKLIGTITAPNVQLHFSFDDLALCRGIFIDFSAESIAHGSGNYYTFGVEVSGTDNNAIQLFRMYSNDETLINNIKTNLFLSKQRAYGGIGEGMSGFKFDENFIITTKFNSNNGYFVVTDTSANNYKIDIYWVM